MENDDTKISDGDEIISFVWSALEEIGSTVTKFWKNDDQMVTRPHLTNSASEIGNNYRSLANIYSSPRLHLKEPK